MKRKRGPTNRVRARNRRLEPGPDPAEPRRGSALDDASAVPRAVAQYVEAPEREPELPPYLDPDRPWLGRVG
jgi:hypothetical protein